MLEPTIPDTPALPVPVPPPLRPLITVTEAAQLVGHAPPTLRRWIRSAVAVQDDLARCVMVLPGGQIRVRKDAFLAWLAGRAA